MKFCKRLVSTLLLAAMLVTCMSAFAFAAEDVAVIEEPSLEANIISDDSTDTAIAPRAMMAEILGNGVRLRKTPGTSGKILAQLNKGEYVIPAMDDEGRWVLVEADGYTWVLVYSQRLQLEGYVASQYVDLENAG